MTGRSSHLTLSLTLGCALAVGCGGSTSRDASGSTGGSSNSGGSTAGGGSSNSGGSTAGGAGGSSGVGGVPGADCAGLDYCACKWNAACTVLSEACFCPCGVEPCEPDCDCACGGGAYLGCAPAAITNPGALEGLWLVGWSGGANHFSWVRFEPDGKATYNDGASLNANLPLWPCNGEGAWTFAAKPDTVFLSMPTGCSATNNVITFDSFVGKPDWPKGCLLLANVSTNPTSLSLMACKFPLSQCNASMSSCADPMM